MRTKVWAHRGAYAPENTLEAFEEAEKKKLPLHVWTVNDKNMMEYLAEQEIEAIITNYPDIAKEIVNKKGKSHDTISSI
jgi:glycerophosphoryl diester phosphodiesterase